MKRTILVADDETSIQKLYERELTREGYNVVCVSNGPEAIEVTQSLRPNLIVMDIRMPGMDGVECMGRILDPENNRQIAVVINTAYSDYKDSFLSWSADAYVTKSSDLTELKETIRDVLAKPDDRVPEPTESQS